MQTNRALVNVIAMGFSFFLSQAAFTTLMNLENSLIHAIKADDPRYNGDAYVAMFVFFGTMALSVWMAPSVIRAIGPRATLFIAMSANVVFPLQFLCGPVGWMLYVSSVVTGLSGACGQSAQGNFLTLNSTQATVARNSAILWFVVQMSEVVGNTSVLIGFTGDTRRSTGGDEHAFKQKMLEGPARKQLFAFMTGVVCAAAAVTLTFRKAAYVRTDSQSAWQAFVEAVRLTTKRDMQLLCVTFCYVGIELSFNQGVYSSSLGFTAKYGEDQTKMVSTCALLVGIGESLAAGLCALISGHGRRWMVVVLGYAIHLLTFACVFVNTPHDAPSGLTDAPAIIPTNKTLAFACALLLGFGDSCYLTQIMSTLASLFRRESEAAFAIYTCVQMGSCAIAFMYSGVGLQLVLPVLVAVGTLGTICFCIVDICPTFVSPNADLAKT